jgi:hypothetical protein
MDGLGARIAAYTTTNNGTGSGYGFSIDILTTTYDGWQCY